MMDTCKLYLLAAIVLSLSHVVVGSHFRGAIIQWRPVNPTNFDGRVNYFIDSNRGQVGVTSCMYARVCCIAEVINKHGLNWVVYLFQLFIS